MESPVVVPVEVRREGVRLGRARDLSHIFRGAFPFACVMLLVLGLIVAFPQISLALL
jgi:TRAP-type mannitol/chloroaromatic compound transport system permease large subunit